RHVVRRRGSGGHRSSDYGNELFLVLQAIKELRSDECCFNADPASTVICLLNVFRGTNAENNIAIANRGFHKFESIRTETHVVLSENPVHPSCRQVISETTHPVLVWFAIP